MRALVISLPLLAIAGCYPDFERPICVQDPSNPVCITDSAADSSVDSDVDSDLDSQSDSNSDSDSDSDSGVGDTCECKPGDVTPVTGTCPGALEKKTKTCTSGCTWGAEVCAIPKGWTKIADPPTSFGARISAPYVWTGGELIIYGGGTGEKSAGFKDAAMYRLLENDWVPLPTPSIVTYGRRDTQAVWDGYEMLVWGGRNNDTFLSDGIVYRSDLKTWESMPTSPIAARSPDIVVWIPTLKRMFIYGGQNSSGCLADGATYDPATETWAKIATSPLACRAGSAAVWTGSEVLIWGGQAAADGKLVSDGALYNPTTNSWRALPTSPLAARTAPRAAITPVGVMLSGGYDFGATPPTFFDDYATVSTGVTPAWSAAAKVPASAFPSRFSPQSWATSDALFLWSGIDSTDFTLTGAVYDFAASTWTPLPTDGAPTAREAAIATSAGKCGVVWGGYGKPGGGVVENLTDGALYCP